MSDHDAVIEAMAQAMYVQYRKDCGFGAFPPWDTLTPTTQEIYRNGARAAWTAAGRALEAQGIVLAPMEPTEEMHAAANREWDGRMSARSAGVYRAMIAARPRDGEDGG